LRQKKLSNNERPVLKKRTENFGSVFSVLKNNRKISVRFYKKTEVRFFSVLFGFYLLFSGFFGFFQNCLKATKIHLESLFERVKAQKDRIKSDKADKAQRRTIKLVFRALSTVSVNIPGWSKVENS
jgi:hypothetical protein